MLLIQQRCGAVSSPDGRLVLPFHLRQKSRLRTRLASGEEVGLFLDRGGILRDGDWLRADDGRHIVVQAAAEAVMTARAWDPRELARLAYHLGNRHVPLQIGDTWVRLQQDSVLRDLALTLGAQVTEESLPFEPEAGAYGGGHRHGPTDGEDGT